MTPLNNVHLRELVPPKNGEFSSSRKTRLLRTNSAKESWLANIAQRTDLSGGSTHVRPDYPLLALQELARNAVIHRAYDGTNAPVRLTWFDDRVEITNPGGPFGAVSIANFGRPEATDYRNPVLAACAKDLGYMQRFGSGMPRARAALQRNGNRPPEFETETGFVHATVRALP